jgi:2-oxoacid:acceptor oxidoreductase gamma subunit (pyruvate/2-ketoisovalerate family)
MDEIKFYGRGGQGVVMASQMLGFAFFKAEFYPQCFSVFGGERRGAPVVSFLRVDQTQILLKCGIKHPNVMIYLDDSLIDPAEVKSLLSAGGQILINTAQPQTAFKALHQFSVGRIDARAIAQQQGLGRTINTAVLGAYCRLSGKPALEVLLASIAEMVPAKKKANLEAARLAYERLETP